MIEIYATNDMYFMVVYHALVYFDKNGCYFNELCVIAGPNVIGLHILITDLLAYSFYVFIVCVGFRS